MAGVRGLVFRLLGLDGVVFKSVFRVWVEGEDFVSGMFLKWHLKSGFNRSSGSFEFRVIWVGGTGYCLMHSSGPRDCSWTLSWRRN